MTELHLRTPHLVSEACPERNETDPPSGKAWLLAWMVFLPIVLIRAGTLAESDTFWQIRTGALIIDHRRIPRADPFSWTAHGLPWTLNSWGFDALIAAAYRIAGLAGAALFCAALAAGVAGLVVVSARRLDASPVVTGVLLVLSAPLLTSFITARPQLIDYLAVLVLAQLLRRIVSGPASVWLIAAVGAVSVCWVNLHAGALLGVVMTGAVAMLVALRRATRSRFGWVLAATAVALAGALVNPYGIHLISQTARVQTASSGVITEWRHFDPTSPAQVITLALGVTALALAGRHRDPVSTALLAVAAASAVAAMRFLPVLLILSLPILASSFSTQAALRYLRSRRQFIVTATVAWLATGGAVAAASMVHAGRPDPHTYSPAVVRAIPAGCRLFNDYLVGGYVILERPDVPVSLDSRNDLYGAQRFNTDEGVLSGRGDIDAALKGAGCVLVPPNSGLANRLDRDENWKRAAGDRVAVLYVRR